MLEFLCIVTEKLNSLYQMAVFYINNYKYYFKS